MRLIGLNTLFKRQQKQVKQKTVNAPHLTTFGGNVLNRHMVMSRAASVNNKTYGIRIHDMRSRAGSHNHSLNGQRLFAGYDGRRARIFYNMPTPTMYRYKSRHATWWNAQVWRKGLYSAIARPESQAKAATYANMSRTSSVVRNHRYTLAAKNRRSFDVNANPRIFTGKDAIAQFKKVEQFTKPYSFRVHYELAQMQFNARQKQTLSPTLTPTVRRYLERMWRVRFRLRFEKFFFKRTGCRTYVWLQSTFRGLRMSYKRRFRDTSAIAASKENRRLAAHWRWSTFQMSVFNTGMTMMMTLPGNLEMPFLTLRRLMKKHRSHFSVIRFFVTYIHRAISKRRLESFYNFRMRIAGKFVGELKRRVCLVGHGEMRLSRYQVPADFYTTVVPTKYGIFGLKYWVQIFPVEQWFDDFLTPSDTVSYEDRIIEEDPKYPGYLVFEQDELVAQWFFREALEEYRHVKDQSTVPTIYTKTLAEMGNENRAADFKLLAKTVEVNLFAQDHFAFEGLNPQLITPEV